VKYDVLNSIYEYTEQVVIVDEILNRGRPSVMTQSLCCTNLLVHDVFNVSA